MKQILKKSFVLTLIICMILSLSACVKEGARSKLDDNKPTVVCTGFAQYDWVKNILGDEIDQWNLVRINEKGTDMHSYQPTAEDMVLINKCDLLIYTGGTSEEWITDAVNGSEFKGKAYALLDAGEPICLEDEHDHEDDHHDHHGHEAEEFDEHIWLSLDNAEDFCEDIAELLNSIKPSTSYEINCESYTEKIEALDERFENALGKNGQNIIIFADRFPFRYLADDYHLTWYAAFPGCSAETEASFDTIKELASTVKQYEASAVFVTETGSDSLAKTVILNSGNSDIDIVKVNSMQSVSKDEPKGYLEIMDDNFNALLTVLHK